MFEKKLFFARETPTQEPFSTEFLLSSTYRKNSPNYYENRARQLHYRFLRYCLSDKFFLSINEDGENLEMIFKNFNEILIKSID